MMSNENTGGGCRNEDKGMLSVFAMLIDELDGGIRLEIDWRIIIILLLLLGILFFSFWI